MSKKKKAVKKNSKLAYTAKKATIAGIIADKRSSVHVSTKDKKTPQATIQKPAVVSAPKETASVLVHNKINYVPKVSVIMPVYNVADYLPQCLDSTLTQTLKEIEIICVDDGSTDASLDILKEYAQKDKRITVVCQQNSGSGKARNFGIKVAKGEFLAFMDSDDMYPQPQTLEHLYTAAVKNNVLICGGSLNQIKDGELVTDPSNFEAGYYFDKNGIVEYQDYQFDYGYWRFIYNSQFIKENKLGFPDYLRQQDPPFFVKTMALGKKFYALKEPTYVYRVSHKQIQWTERKAVDLFKGIRDCLIYTKEYHLDHLHARIAQRLNIWTFRTAAASMISSRNVQKQVLETLSRVDAAILKKEGVTLVLDDVYKAILQAKDNHILISVIVPIYNVEKYLARCLDSLLAQTFKDIEILCVNDGSTDNSAKILEEYAQKDSRIKIVNKKNGGLSSARNEGMKYAKGFYIHYIDSDDYIDPTTFEKVITKMAGPIDLVCYGAELVNDGLDENDQNLLVGKKYHEIKMTGQRQADNDNILRSTYTVWNKLFKKSILDKYGIKFAEGRLFEDNDFTIMYMVHCQSIYYLDEYLYYYVQRPHSIMERLRAGLCDKTADNLYIFDNVYKHLKKYNLLEKYQRVIASRYSIHLKSAYRFAPDAQKNQIKELARKLARNYDADLFWNGIIQKLTHSEFSQIREFSELIISLTSYPGRIGTVNQTIETLLNQQVKADKVILWLAPEQFPNREKDLPQELLDLREKGLTIDWYHDIRPYKKLIPALKKYPNALIVTADDDLLYSPTWLKKLYESYQKYPDDINIHRATKFYYYNGFHTKAGGRYYYKNGSVLNKLSGGAGVIYPPHCFYKDVTNEELFMKLAPTSDDQWFWCQAVLNDKKIRVVENCEFVLRYVPGTQEEGLTKINDQGDRLFWKDFARLTKYYPEFKDALVQEGTRILQESPVPYKDDVVLWCKTMFNNPYYNIDNPKTFNEKMQWLKLYASTPLKTRLADKYLVRDWVKEKIGEKYLIPLIGAYDKFEDIDFDKLPNQFAMKCNHGCAYNIIVQDKAELDLQDTKSKLDMWMTENFGFKAGFELHYRDIKPKIVVEKLLKNKNHEDLNDYKFYCFGGEVKYIQVISDRTATSHKVSFYDLEWHKQPWWDNEFYEGEVEKPKKLEEMTELAKKLCQGFAFVRVDFYYLDTDEIYFGEMTFSPASGAMRWNSPEINLQLGKMIKLPRLAYNMNTGKYYKAERPSKVMPYVLFPYNYCKMLLLQQKEGKQIKENVLNNLHGMRVDIKNVGTKKNTVNIAAFAGKTETPKWLTDNTGIGRVLQSHAMKSQIKLEIVKAGVLKFDFRGQDKKCGNKSVPVQIDYKSIKIDGKEILSGPIVVAHNKPYHYEMPVKDDQEITLEIEQQYHQYTESELKSLVLKLNENNNYIQNNIDIVIKNIKKYFPIVDEATYKKQQLKEMTRCILTDLTSWRLDVKNLGGKDNALLANAGKYVVETPKWLTDDQGVGRMIQGHAMRNMFTFKAVNDGTLKMIFRGQDRKCGKELIPIWIDYKSIKIDGKEILSAPVAVCYNQPFVYEMPLKDGQSVTLEVEQQHHEYADNELKEVLLKLYPQNTYIQREMITLLERLKKDMPIVDAETYKIQQLEDKVSQILLSLTSYRLDIKNLGTAENSLEVTAEDGMLAKPRWFTNAMGIGRVLQGNAMHNTIKLKAIKSGTLRIDFRGQDKRFKSEHLPIWIDFSSIKIDDKEILSVPVATWHDRPYRYEMSVKDGQEITLKIEQQYHRYRADELKNILMKLNENDESFKDISESVFKRVSEETGAYMPSMLEDYPHITADCFIPIGEACRVANWLRKYQLRYCSLPFDWLGGCSLHFIVKSMKEGISDWFNEYTEDPAKATKKSHYVYDTKNQFRSRHAFPLEKSVEEYMPEFRKIFGRRYDRLLDLFNKSDTICFVCNDRSDTIYDFYLFIKEIQKLYPHKIYKLLHVHHNDKKQEVKEYKFADDITIYRVDAYDIHKDGNSKSNPNFWIGNEDLWEQICSNLSLSEKVQNTLPKKAKETHDLNYYMDLYKPSPRKTKYTWDYVKNTVLTQEPKRIALEEITAKTSGLLQIAVGNTLFESVLIPSKTKKIYVFLSSGGKDVRYPVFHRIPTVECYDGIRIYFDDPTRHEINDNGVSWYLGGKGQYTDYIVSIIQKLSQIYHVEANNIIIIGSSNAGFASVQIANKLLGAKSIALNPQLSIYHYLGKKSRDAFAQKIGMSFDDEQYHDILYANKFLENTQSKFFVFINQKSPFDKTQLAYLQKLSGEGLPNGLNSIKDNIFCEVVNVDASNPHNVVPKENFIPIIEKIMDGQIPLEQAQDICDLFAAELKRSYAQSARDEAKTEGAKA